MYSKKKEALNFILAGFVFWAMYWGFWIAFEKPHYDEQERLFKEQLELFTK